jgi:RNA polymerase sigma-70 factor, ECF subfamily
MDFTEGGDQVTLLLEKMRAGDREALRTLVSVLYPELRKIAASRLRKEQRRQSIQPTELVHEAYLRLVGHREHDWRNRAHFFGAASELIHRILVDRARRGLSRKREGDRVAVPLEDGLVASAERPEEFLALDQALTRLGQISPRQLSVVKMRYFAGLSIKDIAEALGVSSRLVDSDWAVARAWLRREMRT